MSKSIKLQDNIYLDSKGITHNQRTLDNILDNTYEFDQYSTEERKIGKWINNKPIYRRTVVLTSGWNAGSAVDMQHSTEETIDEIINVSLLSKRINSKIYQKVSGAYFGAFGTDRGWLVCGYNFGPSYFRLYVGANNSGSSAIDKFVLTLDYTKITD